MSAVPSEIGRVAEVRRTENAVDTIINTLPHPGSHLVTSNAVRQARRLRDEALTGTRRPQDEKSD